MDAEIRKLNEAGRQPGWTKWALLGTAAGLMWLGVDQLERISTDGRSFDWANSCLVVLAISLGLDALRTIATLLAIPSTSVLEEYRDRFILTDQQPHRRTPALIEMGVNGGLLTIALTSRLSVPAWCWIPAALHYTIQVTATVGEIILTYVRVPLGVGIIANFRRAVAPSALFHVTITALPAFEYCRHLLGAGNATYTDLRIGLIMFALSHLLSLLVTDPVDRPVLQALEQARRDLILGRANVDECIHEIEIALEGMRYSDVFQDAAYPVSRLCDVVSDAQAEIGAALASLPEAPPASTGNLPDEAEPVSKLHQAQENLARAENLLAETRKAYKRFVLYVYWTVLLSGGSKTEPQALVIRIDESIARLADRQAELRDSALAASQALDRTPASLEAAPNQP